MRQIAGASESRTPASAEKYGRRPPAGFPKEGQWNTYQRVGVKRGRAWS